MESTIRGASRCFNRRFLELALPLALLLAVTLVIRELDLDLRIQQIFFSPDEGWIYGECPPWSFLYHYGVLPTVLIAFGALFVYVLSFRWDSLRGQRHAACFLVLLSIVGPIVVVNLIFKEHWGRPRPGEVVQLGGEKVFLEAWEKGVSGQGRSFPCGHCSAAFFFFGFYFLYRRRSRRWAYGILVATLAYGALMGVARMVQGGHFASDVLWSAGIMYYLSLGLYWLLGLHRAEASSGAALGQTVRSGRRFLASFNVLNDDTGKR